MENIQKLKKKMRKDFRKEVYGDSGSKARDNNNSDNFWEKRTKPGKDEDE
jgi:hypothetical protein